MKTLLIIIYSLITTISSIAQNIDSLSIKVGQMLLVGFPGPDVDAKLLEEIKEGKIGSIILFEKNVPKTTSAFAPLKKIIWTYQKASPIPLFVCIDQEGGKVNRLKDKYGFTRTISAQDMGKDPTLDSVTFYSEATATTLAGLGINVNFAPVVDLGINKNNPVIYKAGRAFSADPDSVALFAEAYIKPHHHFGIITVLKHFPGHGSSEADSHLGVADVSKTWTDKELLPYKKLFKIGCVDAVMSAHIVNRQIDKDAYPGTLSAKMIGGLLRKKMGFDGVVFSDDMQMQAIADHYQIEEVIKRSINAGIDILCFSNNIDGSQKRTVDLVHGLIKNMVLNGEISMDRINESYKRIMKLKTKYLNDMNYRNGQSK